MQCLSTQKIFSRAIPKEASSANVCTGSSLGLPELSLGILPGFGGTQRLPRLVGLEQAVQMMLTSKPIKDKQALQAGLIDGIFPPGELLDAAKKLALEIADKQKPRNYSLTRSALQAHKSMS